MEKKEDEDASRAADPALEQARTIEADAARESDADSGPEEDEVDEASEDSFPSSDPPSW